ncbi:MAG: hypothetical protein A2020_07665 [Lentisphaerae bacterium GWF2_45_14]|nr:MAG: hypothetical protein A2020_07665 [Lentisphaerae bacterium GWF2_45_14]
MFEIIKNLVIKLLRIPPEPENPMGDSKCIKVFRPSIRYFNYTIALLILKSAVGFITAVIVYLAIILSGTHNNPTSLAIVNILAAIALIILILKFLISLVILRLDYEMRWYKVSDKALRIREGIVRVKELTMAFANIQNLSISQGPVQRMLKIADLKVECAGGGISLEKQESRPENNHIAYFKGIDNAAEIKELLVERLRKFRDSGLGMDHEELHHQASSTTLPPQSDVIKLLLAIRDEAHAFRQSAQQLCP